LQGCYDPFRRLLDKIAFDPARDRLWITGDLVNRGPKSRKTLRFVRKLGDAAVTVLGNHDLHLIAVANGVKQAGANYDSLQKILKKHDCEELIDWLRFRPLAHYSFDLNTLMVHAGIPPQWTAAMDCRRYA
jgi:bis(5'-nucleosyl)-tetraphosphatase (symmetrical)